MIAIITFVTGFVSGMYVSTQIEKGIEQSLHDEHGNINTWVYWKRKHDNLKENINNND